MASVLRRLYLSVYNWIVFIRWVQVSWSMILALLEKRYEAVYAAVEQHLLFAQTAAIMEVCFFSCCLYSSKTVNLDAAVQLFCFIAHGDWEVLNFFCFAVCLVMVILVVQILHSIVGEISFLFIKKISLIFFPIRCLFFFCRKTYNTSMTKLQHGVPH